MVQVRENQSIGKAVALLRLVAERPEGTTVTELARLAGMSRVTASRMLGTLASNGMLYRREDESYVLGPEVARLGRRAGNDDILLAEARGRLEQVLADCNETVTLTLVRPSGKLETILQLDPARVVMTNWVGVDYPLHVSSAGKVFLAHTEPAERGALLPRRLTRFTPHTITSRRELDEQLGWIQESGWAENNEEYELGLSAVSVPLYAGDGDGALAGTVDLSAPTGRLTEDVRQRVVEVLKATAETIASRIPPL
jgi:DNA-binding IclR family transcriptional regulator